VKPVFQSFGLAVADEISSAKSLSSSEVGQRLHLIEAPAVRVVGRACYDAKHKGSRPDGRDSAERLAVWEMHPVMSLAVLPQATKLTPA
jgi:hypothetical protein